MTGHARGGGAGDRGQGTGVRVHLLPFRNMGNCVHPTLSVSFGGYINICCPFSPGVYTREVKDPKHVGKWNKICRRLTNCREGHSEINRPPVKLFYPRTC